MTNRERQYQLDEKKWAASFVADEDLSGRMEHCAYCTENGECNHSQLERISECLCAKAYNRMSKAKKK